MTRPQLKLAPKRKAPSLSQVKRALRLFRSPYVSKATQRANAMAWLRSVAMLGSNWILAGRKEVAWGAKQERSVK